MDRETVVGVIHGIAGQTNGMFAESDFVPAPRSHPTCRSATYAYVEKREATPLPRVLEVGKYPDYITAGRMQGAAAGLGSNGCGRTAERWSRLSSHSGRCNCTPTRFAW